MKCCCCSQVPCSGVLVPGPVHRCSHGDGGGDRGDLGAVHGAGRAWGHRLRHGDLRLQERHHQDLHAAAQDALHVRELQHVTACVCVCRCVWSCVCVYVFPGLSETGFMVSDGSIQNRSAHVTKHYYIGTNTPGEARTYTHVWTQCECFAQKVQRLYGFIQLIPRRWWREVTLRTSTCSRTPLSNGWSLWGKQTDSHDLFWCCRAGLFNWWFTT